MSYRSRKYAAGDVAYRGHVVETGQRMTYETVYDETEEERTARQLAWAAENPGKQWYNMPERWRKSHREERGYEDYHSDRTFGPYATIGPARAAAGTGPGVSRKVEEGIREDGGPFLRVRTAEVSQTVWTVIGEETIDLDFVV